MSELAGLKLLRRIEEGVAGKSGEAFFRQIVCDIAGALNAHAAFTSRLLPKRRATMLAFWVGGRYERCLEYALEGTPCEFVYNGRISGFARDIGTIFPADREWFAELGVNSYLGIPIMDEKGEVFGHLAVMDKPERDWHDADVDILRLFSLRAAVELERERAHRQLAESNESLRLMNEQLRHEVAQRLAMEQQLAAAKAAAESANQAKSMFISQMSHELRTPLNGILGYAQLLKRNDATLTEQQRDGLSIIERSGEHLLTLVNDLLDLAKIEAGKLELHPELVDLYALLEHVNDLIQVRADRAGQHFNSQIASSVPSLVRGDARALRQVLLNLLGNAVKFTDAGGGVKLRVCGNELDADHVRLQFEIGDSGIGMSQEQLSRIFEPFHRIEDPTRRTEGTGLGLTITRRLVEAMNGRINVRSVPQQGTTFIVELDMPLAAVDTRPSEHTRQIVGYQSPVRRILVVDDDAVNRELVANLLASIGFETCTAQDGQQALSIMEINTPDLIITDLVMPQMDGIQLARTVRARSDSRNMPVLALSASASDYTSEEAIASGCTAFLPKPVRLTALLDSIGELLQLEWRFDSSIAIAPTGPSNGPFVLERVHADELYHLALLGDIAALRDRARELLDGNADARHFYAELTALADQYDTAAIRRLLDSSRADEALDISSH
jgi:signal transduction histidine kinase/ActR/RegA family two-component response regulator